MAAIGSIRIDASDGLFVVDLVEDEQLAAKIAEQHGGNAINVTVAITAYLHLLRDSSIDATKPKKVYRRFFYQLINDFKGTALSLNALSEMIVFNLSRRCVLTRIDEILKLARNTPIYRDILAFSKSGEASALKYILTFLSFTKKMYYDDPELDATSLRQWLKLEEDMDKLPLPTMVSNLRGIAKDLFADFVVSGPMFPRHGNGAVAERGVRGIGDKCCAMVYDPMLTEMFRWHESTTGYPVVLPDGSSPSDNAASTRPFNQLKRTSRLKFVPKDWKKTRSICMEPVDFQHAQQGVRLILQEFMDSGILSDYVCLGNQQFNVDASQYGSLTGLVDTIDLSSASDSMSWRLVKAVMPPSVLKYLHATRTGQVELPDGSVLEVKKYAPMGSALCFPVQSIMYSIVVMMVGICYSQGLDPLEAHDIFHEGRLEELLKESFRKTMGAEGRLNPFLCYGDDIITDSRITLNTMVALQNLGFKVNVEKSFYGATPFRESCGGFHYHGIDVSPYRLKIPKLDPAINADTMGALIDSHNVAREHGLTTLCSYLVRTILSYPTSSKEIEDYRSDFGKNPILFTENEDDSFALRVSRAGNSHLPLARKDAPYGGTHADYQRDEVLSCTIQVREYVDVDFDDYFYTQKCATQYHSSGDLGISEGAMKADAVGTAYGWRWTPVV